MANEAAYVALAILVIIITIMMWNRKVDTYSRLGGCQMQCQNLSGSARKECINECLGHQIMRYGGQQCSNDDDCQSAQMCVLGGFYTGEDGSVFPNPNIGTCMDQSDPGVIEWNRISSYQHPNLPHHDRPDNGSPFNPCMSNCLARGRSASECQALCGHAHIPDHIPGHPSKCMSKCLSEGNSKGSCQVLCNPAHDPPAFPSKLGNAAQHLKGKGSAVFCAVQCMNEGQYSRGGYSMNIAKNCRNSCGLPNPPDECMLKCRAGGGSGAECQGLCNPAPPPPVDPSYPTWSFNMTGEITPSKVEGYGYQSCPPGQYWNGYAGKGVGGCEKIFSGKSSAAYVRSRKPGVATEVDIPGTTLPGYGVGTKDPKDIPSGVFISSDPGYSKR